MTWRHSAAAGVRRVVLLAAGMDARAYRLTWPDGTVLFELDHPELLTQKDEVLQRMGVKPRCRRVTLGTDLEHDWAALLVNAGFDNQRSIWLVEGLFIYLEAPVVHHVLAEVSGLASAGSVFVTDMVSRSLLTSPWMQDVLKAMEERGMGWRFGTDDPQGLFACYGWQGDVRQPQEEALKYDPTRFSDEPSGRSPNVRGYFVLAQRTS